MKKILGSFMALVMLLGCSSQSQETQNSDTQNQTAVAQNGDYVNIDFVGKIDGVAFNGGSAEGYELKLGSDTMIDGFEDGIVGMKLDEEKTITVRFIVKFNKFESNDSFLYFTDEEVLKWMEYC